MSAVRFCPWPYPLPLGFNQLDPPRSRLSSIFSFYFAKLCQFSIPDRVMCELLLVAINPARMPSRMDCSSGVNAPLARLWVMPAKPCLKAFWFAGGPDLPRIPAMGDSIANGVGFFL